MCHPERSEGSGKCLNGRGEIRDDLMRPYAWPLE
jgi:hypothetical protein